MKPFRYDDILRVIFTEAPIVIIAILYITMVLSVVRSGRRYKKVILTSSAIVITGLLAAVPDTILFVLQVEMSYKYAQIFTVTLYYVNCVFDPCVYVYSNPKIKRKITSVLSGSKSRKTRQTVVSNNSATFTMDLHNQFKRSKDVSKSGSIAMAMASMSKD